MKRVGIRAILVAIQLLAGSAVAVDKLQADLIPQGLRTRSEASIPVEVRFRWTGTHILEGRLEVELREDNRVLERYRSAALALTTGEQTFRLLLPPPMKPFSEPQVEAHMKFVTDHQTYDLDYSILTMPMFGERSLVVGWCNSPNGADAQTLGLEQSLQFERYAPDDQSRKLLTTSLVRITPEDLPLQPLSYTSYDVLVLAPEAFAEAREGQLNALARWVKGGGSVCVFVGGGLRPYHLSFLNELAESHSPQPAFMADSAGNLLAGHEKMLRVYSGLGRSVIVTGNVSDISEPGMVAWQESAAFLWKFRRQQAKAIAEIGHWDPLTNIEGDQITSASQPLYIQNRFRTRRGRWPGGITYAAASEGQTSLGAELMSQLMPKTIRLIPFGALAGMLGMFLLMIGPVDYFVLGWFGRRRLTWVLFPVTSVAVMLAMVIMANYYLGRHDQRRSLIVVDLDKDGTALRWNRYEMIFAARDKQTATELKDALWTPVVAGSADEYNDLGPVREAGLSSYEGAVPMQFRTTQPMHQWQPVLNRTFSFEPPPVPLLSNWRAVEESWPSLPDIRAKLSQDKPFPGELCAISGANSITIDPQSEEILPRSILQELCLSGSSRFYSLVSQVSPSGGGNFEDVQAMDIPGGDSILAIVTRVGDDVVLYRTFFHGN